MQNIYWNSNITGLTKNTEQGIINNNTAVTSEQEQGCENCHDFVTF